MIKRHVTELTSIETGITTLEVSHFVCPSSVVINFFWDLNRKLASKTAKLSIVNITITHPLQQRQNG